MSGASAPKPRTGLRRCGFKDDFTLSPNPRTGVQVSSCEAKILTSQQPTIAIAAGGTGGHIYPAIAAAEAAMRLDSEVGVIFLCGHREVELEIFRKAQIEPIVLPVGRFGRGPIGKIRTAWQTRKSYGAAKIILREIDPFCLLAMGGFIKTAIPRSKLCL